MEVIYVPRWFIVLSALILGLLGGYLLWRPKRSGQSFGIFNQVDPFRNLFSTFVFAVAVLGIFALMFKFTGIGPDKLKGSEAFTALLPVFSTWVGTILAHYYSKENFEAARSSMQNVVDKLSTPSKKLADIIAGKGIKSNKSVYSMAAGSTPANITLDALSQVMAAAGNSSRVLILDDKDVTQFVVYGSVINSYLHAVPGAQGADSLQTLLTATINGSSGSGLVKRFGLVALQATAQDARKALVGDIRDVIVTASGKSTEPALWWLTDTDLAKL